MEPESRKIVSIYVDGACPQNPGGYGGWGVVVYFDNGESLEFGGWHTNTTNNQMELEAAIQALKYWNAQQQSHTVCLYSDSQYVINSATRWIEGWKSRGWCKSNGDRIANLHYMQRLDEASRGNVKWHFVRGHSGNEGNERADALAGRYVKHGVCLSIAEAYPEDND